MVCLPDGTRTHVPEWMTHPESANPPLSWPPRLNRLLTCAVPRRCLSAGANPARQLSLRPIATGAVVEVTKRLKPLV